MFKRLRKIISVAILTAFIGTSIKAPIYAQIDPMSRLPAPGVMVHLSPAFTPAILKGIVIHPENPLKFDFVIFRGDEPLSGDAKKNEYTKLIKYFLASLAVPDDDQWVNLSPYEKNRIIREDFGKTEMGRDLLAQDYMLKQITASLIYPQDKLGQEFWNKVYVKAYQQFGTTNIPVNTFNKVWIVPDDAEVFEKGNMAYVVKNHLKVMLEEDYLSLNKHNGIQTTGTGGNKAHTIGSQVVREVVLPALEREVNEGKNFAPLRQVFSGVVLAAWYKRELKESFLGKIYMNRSRLKGVDQDPKNNQIIYQQYLKAFKKGVFNFIKEDIDKYSNETIPRKYFSGGALAKYTVRTLKDEQASSAQLADAAMESLDEDIATVFTNPMTVNAAMKVSFKEKVATIQTQNLGPQDIYVYRHPLEEVEQGTDTALKQDIDGIAQILNARLEYKMWSTTMPVCRAATFLGLRFRDDLRADQLNGMDPDDFQRQELFADHFSADDVGARKDIGPIPGIQPLNRNISGYTTYRAVYLLSDEPAIREEQEEVVQKGILLSKKKLVKRLRPVPGWRRLRVDAFSALNAENYFKRSRRKQTNWEFIMTDQEFQKIKTLMNLHPEAFVYALMKLTDHNARIMTKYVINPLFKINDDKGQPIGFYQPVFTNSVVGVTYTSPDNTSPDLQIQDLWTGSDIDKIKMTEKFTIPVLPLDQEGMGDHKFSKPADWKPIQPHIVPVVTTREEATEPKSLPTYAPITRPASTTSTRPVSPAAPVSTPVPVRPAVASPTASPVEFNVTIGNSSVKKGAFSFMVGALKMDVQEALSGRSSTIIEQGKGLNLLVGKISSRALGGSNRNNSVVLIDALPGTLNIDGLQVTKENAYRVILGYPQKTFGNKNSQDNLMAVLRKLDEVLGQWQSKLKQFSGNLKIENGRLIDAAMKVDLVTQPFEALQPDQISLVRQLINILSKSSSRATIFRTTYKDYQFHNKGGPQASSLNTLMQALENDESPNYILREPKRGIIGYRIMPSGVGFFLRGPYLTDMNVRPIHIAAGFAVSGNEKIIVEDILKKFPEALIYMFLDPQNCLSPDKPDFKEAIQKLFIEPMMDARIKNVDLGRNGFEMSALNRGRNEPFYFYRPFNAGNPTALQEFKRITDTDSAMKTNDLSSLQGRTGSPLGGIDLNTANFAMTIKRDGKGVSLPLTQQDMAQLNNLAGLNPVILQIQPANQSSVFSKLVQPNQG